MLELRSKNDDYDDDGNDNNNNNDDDDDDDANVLINNDFLKHKQANIKVNSRRFGVIVTPLGSLTNHDVDGNKNTTNLHI